MKYILIFLVLITYAHSQDCGAKDNVELPCYTKWDGGDHEFQHPRYPYARRPNGCSIGFGSDPGQLDNFFSLGYDFSFKEACNKHDRCYYRLGSSGTECNLGYLKDLNAVCAAGAFQPLTWSDITFGTYRAIAVAACFVRAETMSAAVGVGESSYHDEAQVRQREYLDEVDEYVAEKKQEQFLAESAEMMENISTSPGLQIEMKEIIKGDAYLGGDESFWISPTEITQQQFAQVLHEFPSKKITGNPNLPVENLTVGWAILFCNALSIKEGYEPVYRYSNIIRSLDHYGKSQVSLEGLWADNSRNGYRLPSEDEWNFAYGDQTIDDSITESDLVLHYFFGVSHEVALYEPNENGLYDMFGNMFEFIYSPSEDESELVFGAKMVPWDHLLDYGHGIESHMYTIGFRVARNLDRFSPVPTIISPLLLN